MSFTNNKKIPSNSLWYGDIHLPDFSASAALSRHGGVSLCVPKAASAIPAAGSTLPGCRKGLAPGCRDTLRCQQHMGPGQSSWLSSQPSCGSKPSLILTPRGALGAKSPFCKLAPFWEALGQTSLGLQLGHAGMAEPQWIKAHREQTHIHQNTTQLSPMWGPSATARGCPGPGLSPQGTQTAPEG